MGVLPLTASAAEDAERTGPKAAALARLRRAGLPVPGGFCVLADAYRSQLAGAGLENAARQVSRARGSRSRRLALEVRLGLLSAPLPRRLAQSIGQAYDALSARAAVRSSAVLEDGTATSLAGQLETLLDVVGREEVETAVRACWASLWASRALTFLRASGLDPAATAVAVLVQQLVAATAAGGALSRDADGRMVLTAAWGLGAAVAGGEVIPDRYRLGHDGTVLEDVEPGSKTRMLARRADGDLRWGPVAAHAVSAPCLDRAHAVELAQLVRRAEGTLGFPVEVEWALDGQGFHLLQARRLRGEPDRSVSAPGHDRWGLKGQPGGAGWAVGPARLVRAESELARLQPGDILVTRVPGPALAEVLSRVAAVVTELGGSTTHLAALARERQIPAVLGARGATRRIPDGARIIVDGDRGVVRLEEPSPDAGGVDEQDD